MSNQSKSVRMMIWAAFLTIPGSALAADGWYMGVDLGGIVGPGPKISGSDNDLPTRCDQFIDAATACSGPAGLDSWKSKHDAGLGILAGSTLGYRWRNFRFEGEYFYRHANHSSTKNLGSSLEMKSAQELVTEEDAVNNASSHNFFANLYYDFTSDSKWTPYLGFGAGFARTSLDYSVTFARNSNPASISTFSTDELNGRLAGTSTIARSKLSDTMFGYQAIAGVDYRVSEPVTIGLKFRWVDFGAFKDSDEYRQLRSHDSTNSPVPGDSRSARVRYGLSADDMAFWALSLSIKYHF